MDHLKEICAVVRNLLKQMPKADLGLFPAPLYRPDHLSEKLGMNLYIKRDDSIGMNLFGGNGIRKLRYLIGDAAVKGREYVFTFEVAQPNHAMRAVSACRHRELEPVLHLVVVVEPDGEDLRSDLLLDRIMGAEIHMVRMSPGGEEVEAEERSVRVAREHVKQLETQGHKCYEVSMGEASLMGSVGFTEGSVEFAEQVVDTGIHPDYISHGTGTGGAMVRLVVGKVLTGPDIEIISINASWKDGGYPKCTQDLANGSPALLGAPVLVEAFRGVHTGLNYYLLDYEIPGESVTETIQLLA